MDLVTGTLVLLGVGFLVANAGLLLELLRFRRRRRSALLIWPGPPPPYYGLTLALGLATGLLVVVKLLVVHRQAFGEIMMFIYFGYLVPFTRRIGRGFYGDGIWTDSGFIPYHEIGGISWREGEHAVSLIVTSRLRHLARRLSVPSQHYGEARRLLRDKIGEREIHLGAGLDLGMHDARDNA